MKHIEEKQHASCTGRIINANYGTTLLLLNNKNRDIIRVTTELLSDVFVYFKDLPYIIGKKGYKPTGTWQRKVSNDIMRFPGKTLAVIDGYGNDARLIIYDRSIVQSLLKKTPQDGMVTANEYAEQNDKSTGHVRKYCSKGLILGAKKIGGVWFIPEEAKWPGDGRCTNRRQNKALNTQKRKEKQG